MLGEMLKRGSRLYFSSVIILPLAGQELSPLQEHMRYHLVGFVLLMIC